MVKNPPANARDLSSIPGSGRFPGEGNGYLLQYAYLKNSMDRGAGGLRSIRSQKNRTQLNNKALQNHKICRWVGSPDVEPADMDNQL